ncbi:MAG: M23 family metallopeptidase, partial [Myxococcota bacterium]
TVPESLDEQLRLLLGCLRARRVLLVLDNMESILTPERAGAYRAGYHVVRSGESLTRIARRYRVPIAELRRLNRVRGDRIRIGQRLRIPGRRSENPMPRVAERAMRPDQESAAARAEGLGIGSTRAGQNLLKGAPRAEWVNAAADAPSTIPAYAYGVGTPIETPEADEEAEDETPAAEAAAESAAESANVESEPEATPPGETREGTLLLPIDTAYYMRGWGSGPGGYHLAVDIGSPPGTPIRASERGIVAYVGTGIRGYGRFVMIVHPSGLVTAYAHNRETLVVAGELVARGQIVSLLGNTGLSRGPHLHFMLLHEGEHCDPLPLLRPAITLRNGRAVETRTTRWGEERPEEVRCLPRNARRHPGVRRRSRSRRRRR